jgi:RNA polymerase sigma-70 factor (ECF subfamily)
MPKSPPPPIPEEAVASLYAELRRMASFYLRRERSGHTLQPTALVHEAYLRLTQQRNLQWQNKSHFFGIAAPLMRRILVDYSRDRHAAKRRGDVEHVELDQVMLPVIERSADIVALDEALDALAAFDPLQTRIVELRFFSGLNIQETAEVIGVSASTVKREWAIAKAWLARRLDDQQASADQSRE